MPRRVFALLCGALFLGSCGDETPQRIDDEISSSRFASDSVYYRLVRRTLFTEHVAGTWQGIAALSHCQSYQYKNRPKFDAYKCEPVQF
jgi:hypothetical protein